MRHSPSLPQRLAVSGLFEQDMRKFSDFDYKNARNDWNHAEITFIAQISIEISIFILFFNYYFFTFDDEG